MDVRVAQCSFLSVRKEIKLGINIHNWVLSVELIKVLGSASEQYYFIFVCNILFDAASLSTLHMTSP